ncbi:SMP-30/gluconolactonase/LRE family protein [Salinisphaera sp. Q1T1-3]|uniref:SMP-30/gluconolactonase/LRE family protein n=1 Tax=Salinisphaera sp. Q1T1-3 TaxID=2321229 RepID=UPI000E754291|nr:SMP-30/gluconolactonase/LRE family protein [Salinisphaera sp. Q1T1-3]RJS91773.1 SMP-30/gluconolactonase/LRE family protein [Salinisphaera sp. Q1T1-3]
MGTRNRRLGAVVALGWMLSFAMSANAAPDSDTPSRWAPVVAKNAKLTRISDRFEFTEGPAADAAGNVYFTDQPNNKIWKYGTDGNLSIFMKEAGRANGLYFDAKRNLIAAADAHGQLWSIAPDGQVHVVLDHMEDHQMNGPNDLWIAPNGGIYFTDPYYQRDYWLRQSKDQPGEDVYYLGPETDKPIKVVDDMIKPNGIIGTPDGKTLYVSDFGGEKTWRYTIGADGRLSGKQLFTPMRSDGMTLDDQGNVYLTGDGVTIFNRDGKRIGHIPIDEEWTGNVTFAGSDHRTLFITASHSVFTLPMAVAGAPSVVMQGAADTEDRSTSPASSDTVE